MDTLTRKQREIIDFLLQNPQAFAHPPSLEELCGALGLKSRGSLLKIDQSFVRNMLHDSDDLAIIEAVVGLARTFRLYVIAEGVETGEHGTLLLQLGCELAQGYGIARPMPADQLPKWAMTWRPHPAWGK